MTEPTTTQQKQSESLLAEGTRTDSCAEYRDRYVAFLDLMGFRWIIEESTRDPNAFRVAQEALEIANEQRRWSQDLLAEDAHRIYLFSDTVLITCPFTDNGLDRLFETVAKLSQHLIYNYVFLRGAVVRGQLFEREHVVFGPGLIRAYDLESKLASYPRVLVSEDVVQRTALIPYQPRGRDPMTLRHRLRRDADGLWFLDWLRHYHKIYEPGSKGVRTDSPIDFEMVKSTIGWSLGEFKQDRRVLTKVRWFANHFNRVLAEGRELNILGRHRNLEEIIIDI
jgi:hypothetical protein